MHILNKKFDKVVCINLVNRQDKKQAIEEKFNTLGIDVTWCQSVKYGFAPGVIKTLVNSKIADFNIEQPNEMGAALEHYTVIKHAYESGLNSIFVFEDDCLFYKDFNSLLEKCLDELPDNWDMIMLYSFMYKISNENIRVNKRWMKAFNSWSLLAYGMNRNMMKAYIDEQDRLFQIADKASFRLQDRYNVYISLPCLVIPNIKFGSDIRKEMNYAAKGPLRSTNNEILIPDILLNGMNKNNYI
jgi:GR25 family glycosyltransferase involved in LPS biosynthesis